MKTATRIDHDLFQLKYSWSCGKDPTIEEFNITQTSLLSILTRLQTTRKRILEKEYSKVRTKRIRSASV
jgi:hypothetical protein